MSIAPTVKEFKHIPGENDLEYIKLLKEHSDNQRKIINKAIAKIKALSAERKKGEWIPISERLPEEEGSYLVTDDAGGVKTVQDDEFLHYEDGTPLWLYSQNVTAWQPLPEPYRGRQDEID